MIFRIQSKIELDLFTIKDLKIWDAKYHNKCSHSHNFQTNTVDWTFTLE